MTECEKENRPVLKAYDFENKRIYLFQPRCKTWDCKPCARANVMLWKAKIAHGYAVYENQEIKDWMFVTITSHRRLTTADQCLHVWKSAWPKLSARMRRKYKGIRYILIPEHHQDGRVHWHMIASHGLSERWLKDNCATSGLGYIDESKPVREQSHAVSYVAKYLGKTLGVEHWPRGLRRIRTTQKWPELPPKEEFDDKRELNWNYWLTYPHEGIGYLAHELELETDTVVLILGEI